MMESDFITTRRWFAALSAVGAANMTVASLRQLGVIRHLPDPPIAGFDSNVVLVSSPAFVFGVPDAPLAAAGLLANIPLSLLGGRRRGRRAPWLPLFIAAKSAVELSVAAWYFVQMPRRVGAWCAYCIGAATIYAGLAALALPEASDALRRRSPRSRG